MAETILYGVAQELLKNLASRALQEIASALCFKNQLKELEETTTGIKNVLLDAEDKQSSNQAVGDWLRRLQDVIYAADDLVDEFVTVASRKDAVRTGNRFTKEVRLFFSSSNQIAFAFKVARKIKKIRGKLDRISRDAVFTQFAPTRRSDEEIGVRRGREETDSLVNVEGVFGREVDKSVVLGMLLSPTAVEENVSVISIVGVGGMGKTTLAQCVYNDEKVKKHFELRLWVCISEVFDRKEIVKKILKSETNGDAGELSEKISGKKYLLVLDDVWNEDRNKWLELRDILMCGRTGSKILATTRSMKVAEAMEGEQNIPPHRLGGLSEKDSWFLFAKMAFKPGQQQMYPNLVELGREIVKKCANAPLAIRTIGSLLYGEDESMWRSLKETGLVNITGNGNGNDIFDVLKVSYHHLPSQLKHCFAYCALWPKDCEIEKEQLIRMWMAQGFLVSSLENRSPEDVGEEYFMCLLNRCFFQDVDRDEWGSIISCNMHDLMHDLAQKVVGGEIVAVESDARNLNERIRHLSIFLTSLSESLKSLLKLESLRTLQINDMEINMSIFHQLVSGLRCLRVLNLSQLDGFIELLPRSIGKLIHLRYLDLSWWPIEALPDSILKLWNLQTLNLSGCDKLKRLPEDIGKLINLRHLDLSGCHSLTQLPVGITLLKDLRSLNLSYCSELTRLPEDIEKLINLRHLDLGGWVCLTQLPVGITMLRELRSLNVSSCSSMRNMPSGMGNLTAIRRLGMFIVGTKNSSGSDLRTATAGLRDLGTLNNLRGRLEIWIGGKSEDLFSDEAKIANWRSKHGLSELKLEWEREEDDNHESNRKEDHEGVLEGLQLPPNLKKLEIVSYMGARLLPSWASVDQLTRFLPNLVEIRLHDCKWCQNLPLLGQLRFLKCLVLEGLESVEYMESDTSLSSSASSALFFPSLEELHLKDMSGLRGWRKEEDIYIRGPETSASTSSSSVGAAAATVATEQHHLATTLSSSWQPPSFPKLAELTVFECPNMASMPLIPCVEVLKLKNVNGNLMRTAFAFGSGLISALKLKRLEIDDGGHLISIPRDCLQNLSSFQIREQVDWLSIGQVFTSGALSSLRELCIQESKDLQSLGEIGCDELELSNSSSDGNGIMPWKALQSLRELKLSRLPKMRALPEWIRSLTSLESLYLSDCPGVERLPEGIRSLPNLTFLHILNCSPTLTERCRDLDGEDWPLISHIPFVIVPEVGLFGPFSRGRHAIGSPQ